MSQCIMAFDTMAADRSALRSELMRAIGDWRLVGEFFRLACMQGVSACSSIWAEEGNRESRLRHLMLDDILVRRGLFVKVDEYDGNHALNRSRWYIRNPQYLQIVPGITEPADEILEEIRTVNAAVDAGLGVHLEKDGSGVTKLVVER